jgi:hypothetical protein
MIAMRRLALILALAVGLAAGCNAIFGISDYSVVDDASAGDGANDSGEAAVNCDNFDPSTGVCYPSPCPPKTDPEFLNACTGSQCIPFDDTKRIPGYSPDGSLPLVPDLPPVDAGDAG